MKRKLRRFAMGLCIHLLLSGFLLAGLRVMHTGYNHMHSEHVRAASLTVTGDTAELSVLSQRITLPLPPEDSMAYVTGYLLLDDPLRVWWGMLSEFTK